VRLRLAAAVSPQEMVMPAPLAPSLFRLAATLMMSPALSRFQLAALM
jgi:hypothetical protein